MRRFFTAIIRMPYFKRVFRPTLRMKLFRKIMKDVCRTVNFIYLSRNNEFGKNHFQCR